VKALLYFISPPMQLLLPLIIKPNYGQSSQLFCIITAW